MQTLFDDKAKNRSIIGSGLGMVFSNKRYILWFWVLNLALAGMGASAFRESAHSILDHSLYSSRLIHGFDLSVMFELFARPEFGSTPEVVRPALSLAIVFFFLTALFLPGVFAGYASTYRLPREDFFRACGRNLWRFIRLMLVAALVMIPLTSGLFALHGLLEDQAAKSTNELLLPEVRLAGLLVIFLVMAAVRIWFDLAQVDIVLSDQRAVRRSIAAAFRHTWRNLGRLLGSYVVTTIFAAIVLVVGLWAWVKFVPPASIVGAFLLSQLTLLILLIPRFWQRGVVVSYYLKNMVEPIAVQPFTPVAVVTPAATEPVLAPAIPPRPEATGS